MNDPVRVLKSFMAEMHNWQLHAARMDEECDEGKRDYDEAGQEAVARRREIFARYCTRDAKDHGFSYSVPAEYDLEQETIQKTSQPDAKRMEIWTKENAGKRRDLVYTFVSVDGEWRIRGRAFISDKGARISAAL